jgi:hypothetical protein
LQQSPTRRLHQRTNNWAGDETEFRRELGPCVRESGYFASAP